MRSRVIDGIRVEGSLDVFAGAFTGRAGTPASMAYDLFHGLWFASVPWYRKWWHVVKGHRR